MNVILLEKMRKLGALGDRVKVKRGYGRNYLIPQGKAVVANKENLLKFEQRRAELEKVQAEKLQLAQTRQKKLVELSSVTLKAKAGEEGKLFGSIGTRDIAIAITEAGVPIEKREVQLSEGTLRMLGEYEVVIELESDVTATIKVLIVPEA